MTLIYPSCTNGYITEYVWIDGDENLRSKIKIIPQTTDKITIKNIPLWNYDGSSTNQGTVDKSEVILVPRRLFCNPFHSGYLVMCDTFTRDEDNKLVPHSTNTRFAFQEQISQSPDDQAWFGIEQEYYIEDGLFKMAVNDHYCGANVNGRQIAIDHMHACLEAGLIVSGINAEVGCNQWEYQIGPVKDIDVADQLWMSRYILQRIAEIHKVKINFDPKPYTYGDRLPGSGCHVNFSTLSMRSPNGYSEIVKVIDRLGHSHDEYIKYCGKNSDKRLTGKNETAEITKFSYGIGTRNTAIRIPTDTFNNDCGYFEDRRPSSNMDPYVICRLLMASL